MELFGGSSAESPFVLLKCIVPNLLPEGKKKETFTSIFDLLCSIYCINFFATTLVDRERRKVLLTHRYHSIQNQKFGRANVQIFLVSKNKMIMCGLSLKPNY